MESRRLTWTCLLLRSVVALAEHRSSPSPQLLPPTAAAPAGWQSSCLDELAQLCASARRSSAGNCLVCTGTHQSQLMRAGCSNPTLESWCSSHDAEPPPMEWAKGYTFGRAESHPHAGVECVDGGFLVVGDGQDPSDRAVKRSIMVLKTDRAGNTQWQQSFGDRDFNYGKFGIELPDGRVLVAGAMTGQQEAGGRERTLLQRTLLLLDGETGSLLQRLSLPNSGWRQNLRDGFMCIALADDSSHVVATGFIGGENSTVGGADQPMFLVYGGQAFAMKLTIVPELAVEFELTIEADPTSTAAADFRPQQGMRILHDANTDAYIVSHTVLFADSDDFEFGLTSISAEDGTINWVRAFPAETSSTLRGYASHPYALTQGLSGHYAIGGLASLARTTEGRLVEVDPNGKLVFDQRFAATEKDANVECYGLQATPDAGYILTCGTGVEPELYPKDSPQSKTWRVLVHRTDAHGVKSWERCYTDNSELQNNAGEYIVTTKAGKYAVFVDSQTWGSPETGGNFAIILLASDSFGGDESFDGGEAHLFLL